MTRSLWLIVAMVAYSLTLSGCKMCEHCLDYDYPAFGGCWGWHADDHCRAGSAFCGMHGGPDFHGHPVEMEYADPVPRAGHGAPNMPAEETPSSDLTPPNGRRLRPLGNEPLPSTELPDTEAPAPPALETLPVDEEPIPDPFDR